MDKKKYLLFKIVSLIVFAQSIFLSTAALSVPKEVLTKSAESIPTNELKERKRKIQSFSMDLRSVTMSLDKDLKAPRSPCIPRKKRKIDYSKSAEVGNGGNPLVSVRPSLLLPKEDGLFADHKIEQGTIIGWLVGKNYDTEEQLEARDKRFRRNESESSYVFAVSKMFCNGKISQKTTSYYIDTFQPADNALTPTPLSKINHLPRHANSEFEIRRSPDAYKQTGVALVATRMINKDDELYIDYGKDFEQNPKFKKIFKNPKKDPNLAHQLSNAQSQSKDLMAEEPLAKSNEKDTQNRSSGVKSRSFWNRLKLW